MELCRWCFVNEHGEPSPIEEADLRSALTLGKLAPSTLVWRSGWNEWLPAERVQHLSSSLWEVASDARDPVVDPKRNDPPPLPVASDHNGPSARLSTPIPPPRRQKPLFRRPPVPTIAEGDAPIGGDTLRPPGAVPPPPRGTPQSLIVDPSLLEDSDPNAATMGDAAAAGRHGQSHRPSTSSMRHAPSNGRPSTHERSATNLRQEPPDDADLDVPPEELSAPRQPTAELPSIPYDPDSLETRASTPNLHVKVWSRVKLSPRAKWLPVAVLTLAVSSLGLGSWLILRRPAIAPVKAAATSPPSASAPPVACSVARPAARISPSILMSVGPIAADAEAAGRLLVGFAEGPTTAAAIAVDPNDLDVSFPFRETKESRVVSVTPLQGDGHPSFFVLRENQTLKQARAIDASVDFLFGLSGSGFARQPIGGTLESVWPVDAKANVTDPRIASVSGLGHAVTFRQGGQSGSIQLGWLTEAGRALSGPFQVKSSVSLLGNPTLGTDAKRAVVAYAGRASDTEPWSIHLSFAELGQPPQPAAMFTQPAGGPGGDCIAPAIVAIPNHRWLLQWSEGPQGQRQVRLQTLDSNGHPLGLSHTISPVGSNSGQGLLWSSGQRAVSLFVVSVGRSAELWATPLDCPE